MTLRVMYARDWRGQVFQHGRRVVGVHTVYMDGERPVAVEYFVTRAHPRDFVFDGQYGEPISAVLAGGIELVNFTRRVSETAA